MARREGPTSSLDQPPRHFDVKEVRVVATAGLLGEFTGNEMGVADRQVQAAGQGMLETNVDFLTNERAASQSLVRWPRMPRKP